ncbi:hypothetical protein, partial [Pyramidobacter piscolens]|uniref:hypothetical protein n=1 Tax=Pyramidobacter piscolens TaxID=638849 RepID=UPI003321FB5F
MPFVLCETEIPAKSGGPATVGFFCCSKKTPGCAGGSGSFKLWLSILFFIEVKEMLPGIMIEVAGNRIRNNR